ncbi:type I pullulanase [bacterium]|nr:type I pullulanase [bacterium]
MRRLCLLLLTVALALPAVAQDDVTLRIHYHRFDDAYSGWGIHLWNAVQEDGGTFVIDGVEYDWNNPLPWTATDDWGVYWDIPISAPENELGFIIHNGGIKDPGPDQFWGDYDTHPEIWILSGFTQIFTEEPNPDVRMMSATSDGDDQIRLRLARDADQIDAFRVMQGDQEVTVESRTVTEPRVVLLDLAEPVDITAPYTVTDDVGGNTVTVRHEFDDAAYAYDGDDLGFTYTPGSTTFKLWSPVASAASVHIFDSPYPVDGETPEIYPLNPVPGSPGVRAVTVPGDHEDRYYLYEMTVYGETYLTPDLYSVALSSNSQRSQIIDLDETDPEGWDQDEWPSFPVQDSVVYEIHIRDVTTSEFWNGSAQNKHKFLGVVEPGTSYQGEPTGFDHMLDLGINTVQILPMYDFTSVDENDPDSRNWGYDPYAYNAPEGSYSTNPDDGKVRIREMKAMIKAFHDAGIKVVMDVVYNHTHNVGPQGSLYDAMVPKYYYRLEEDGSYSNGSGVGNEVATEKLMARQFILQSCKYWVEEFRVDGFRFDLMGLIDTDLMEEITDEVKAINPHAIIYGEPWGGYGGEILTGKGDQRGLGFGCFNDNIRNAIRGSTDGTDPGYAMNDVVERGNVIDGIEGAINDFTDGPSETINYISAHDNYTWWDKLDHRWNPTNPPPGHDEETLIRMNRFGISMVLTAQGIPFLHAGSEFLRTKRTGDPDQDEETIRNSYNADDEVNKLDWARRVEYDDVVEYYKGLIALRLARPELRLQTKAEIESSLHVLEDTGDGIAYTIDDQTPEDGWGDLMIVHNPGPEALSIALPAGQWAQVVDATTAGTDVLTTYVSPAFSPALIDVAPRSTAVLYQQAEPPLQLNLFQNVVLDRHLLLAVNAREATPEVEVTVNGESVALEEQATGSWFGAHVMSESGELVITVAAADAMLTRTVSVWSLDGGAEARSHDGRLVLEVPAGARPGGWLMVADRTGRPELGQDTWLLGAPGARLLRPATLRIEPTGDDQVIQQRAGDRWRTLATTVGDDGRLEAEVTDLGLVRLAPGEQLPRATRLLGNAPNPFNPTTEIRFDLAASDASAPVRLRVYDVRGQLVRTLVDAPRPAGVNTVVWDGRNDAGRPVASGVYVYRLETARQALSGRMLMLK